MKVSCISYPTPLSQIKDIYNDNVDVFVELEDGSHYVIVAMTPKNLLTIMDQEGVNHYIGAPAIIVKSLTHEHIYNAVESCSKDEAYWLKMYHLIPGGIDINDINKLYDKEKMKNKIIEQG